MKCPHQTCGYEWTPRKENPRKCPQCQNPLWTSPRPKKRKPVAFDVVEPGGCAPTVLAPQDVEVEIADDGSVVEKTPTPIDDRKARAEELLRRLA